MTTAPSGELTAATVIPLIESGTYSRDVVMTIAQGFLPLPQEDLISVLAYLSASQDGDVRAFARTSLGEIPARAVLDFAAKLFDAPFDAEDLVTATRVDMPSGPFWGPLTAVDYIVVVFLAQMLLGEIVTPARYIGVGLIVVGVTLVSRT